MTTLTASGQENFSLQLSNVALIAYNLTVKRLQVHEDMPRYCCPRRQVANFCRRRVETRIILLLKYDFAIIQSVIIMQPVV